MAFPWAPLAIAGGSALIGGLFGGKKDELDIPSFGDFYKDYRQEFGGEFGLSNEELGAAYGTGARDIRRERDIGIARTTRALPQDSVAQGLAPIQSAVAAERQFGRFVLQLSSYAEQARRSHEARFFQEAAQAYGLTLNAEQLQLQASQQSANEFGGFLQSITDPIASWTLYQDMQKINALNQQSETPR